MAILAQVLASDINLGYQDTGNIQVLAVNDTKVTNLAYLAHLLNSCTSRFVKLELEWNKVLYIDHTKATQLLTDILEQNSIPAAHSKGLMEAWQPAKAATAAVAEPAAAAAPMQVDGGSLTPQGGSVQSSDEAAALAAAGKL